MRQATGAALTKGGGGWGGHLACPIPSSVAPDMSLRSWGQFDNPYSKTHRAQSILFKYYSLFIDD